MHSTHGFSRLVFFSDAVVAIAITLLVLPLVEIAAEYDGDTGAFLWAHTSQLFAFALSFVMIGNFWMVHHRLYERAAGYSSALMWANLLWLASIVFLPFPTALIATGGNSDTGANVLYIGTLLTTTAAALLQQWLLIRSPALQSEQARGTLELGSFLTASGIMVVALVLALAVPGVGLFGLLLLFLSRPVEWLASRRRKAAP